jgi:DNA-binding transcriptional regulator YhcF (GntR family)
VRIVVDPAAPDAPYDQVRRQVTALVSSGDLRPGDRLPTVRGLAQDLGLAVNTVARAYRELESAGVIETRGRAGSFVTGDDVQRSAKEAAAAYVEHVRSLGLSPDEALALVTRALGGGGSR